MRSSARILTTTFALATVLAAAACGESGSSGTSAGGGGEASGDACAPIPGDQLVVLEDDKGLQAVDNIIPAINTAFSEANPGVLEVLSSISTVLTTEDLVAMNSGVDIERQSAEDVAAAYVSDNDLGADATAGSGAVVVGAASFTESQILANVYADTLNAAGYTASVQTVGQRETYLPALEAGDFDVFPEYVGTLTEYLDGNPDEAVASSDLDATVEVLRPLGEAVGLTFGEPAEAADENAFAITTTLQDELGGVTTLSELAEACSDGSLVLGGTPECPTRPFCQPGLEETYGFTFAQVNDYDLGAPTNQALIQGEISLALALSTDPVFAQ
ncbi:glycine/betaine ABC transporter substrate-binding protein [Geodermatophilus sp. Leaf369]|uniref:glycine betaine ABC transporter substrate-binding protein n=1 Tax=Geodermatophilus sp. Leaf369 TaxID=1736354 RepID=UPI0006F379D6|nr:glycine betaine ABC transporter substrate-binding protein [Geodermatophilus sp. Leaf369]KQS60477.1 glycine/betaine ABC transporter substrate-binding protein [Geodermatophilus sp. Leaf369]